MQIELNEPRDHGKRIVPLNTGKVQIGRCYQPKPTVTDAQWIERHTAKSWRAAIGWSVVCVLSALGLVVIVAGR